jgi:cytochrome c-type biogenesis protein CcmE
MEMNPSAASELALPPARLAGRRLPPLKFLIAGTAIVLTFAYLVTTAMSTSTEYYLTVGELKAKGAAAYNAPVRVGGRAADGSIANDTAAQTLHFTLTDNSGSLPVVYKGVVPDMFGYAKDGRYQDAVVEGSLQRDGTFVASQIIVKHDARFAAADATATAGAGLAPATTPPAAGEKAP